jgi:hypothetical protein
VIAAAAIADPPESRSRSFRDDRATLPWSGRATVAGMNSQRQRPDQVFILRFWREDDGVGEPGHWRVLVRNINSRRGEVVDDVQRAFAVVASSLNTAIAGDMPADPMTNEKPKCS